VKKSVFLLATCLLLVCGCADDPEKIIVGKWQEVNNPKGALLFNSDHSGQAYWPDEKGAQQSSEMKWQLLKNENKVSVITPPGPVIFEVKGNQLVAPNGVLLTRIK